MKLNAKGDHVLSRPVWGFSSEYLFLSLCRQIELQQSKKTEVEDLDGNLQSLSSKQHQLEKEVQSLKEDLARKVGSLNHVNFILRGASWGLESKHSFLTIDTVDF